MTGAMSRICDICGKGRMINNSGIHAHSGKWHRKAPKVSHAWKVNLRSVRLEVTPGQTAKMRLCTSCLKKTRVVEK